MLHLKDTPAAQLGVANDVWLGNIGTSNVWDLVEYDDVPYMHENRIEHPPMFLAADWTMSFVEPTVRRRRGRPCKGSQPQCS